MRKLIFLSTLFLVIIGCDTNDEVRLNVIGENASNLKALNSMKPQYESKTNIKITYHPYSFTDALDKSMQDLKRGTGNYDIIMQYNFAFSSFVEGDYVYNMSDFKDSIDTNLLQFENELFQNAWFETGFYYGENDTSLINIGYPFASNTMILAYNNDLFNSKELKSRYMKETGKEIEPPKTWDDFISLAKFFTDKKRNIYGVCLQGATDGWLYYEWCNFLFGMDGKVMDKEYGWQGNESTPILINSKEAVNATKKYLELRPYNGGDYFTTGAYEQIQLMKNGNIAMAIIWSDLAYALINNGDNTFDKRFGFAPIPGSKSGLAGGSFFINKKSKHPKEAFKYIVDILQPKNQIELLKRGLCSALRTAYDDKDVQNIPYIEALRKSLKRGVYMFEAGPDANKISELVTTYLQKIWKSQLKVEEGLNQLKKEIELARKEIYNNSKK